MILSKSAEMYAERGWRVVPLHTPIFASSTSVGCSCQSPKCASQGKHPRLKNWTHEASCDSEVIQKWGMDWPDGNIGVALGSESGLVAIDIDSADGERILNELASGELPDTCEMLTSQGKRRLLFAIPEAFESEPKTKAVSDPNGGEAIRFQGKGSQCVMPPSAHPSGAMYRWVPGRSPADIDPAPMPGWLIIEMLPPPKMTADISFPFGANVEREYSPATDFNARCNWQHDILEPAGFKFYRNVSGTEYYTRPGKESGISVSVGHCKAKDGTPALYSFSGSIPELPANKSYDAFGAYTRLYCNGDFAEAGRKLVQRGYGELRAKKQPAGNKMKAKEKEKPFLKPCPGMNASTERYTRSPILTRASDIEPQEVRWLWQDRIALGRITLIVGRPGEGKSFLTMDMAACVTNGKNWPDESHCSDGDVIVINVEDDPGDTIVPRLIACGADRSRVHLLSGVAVGSTDGKSEDRIFNLSETEALETALQSYPNCKLVIIDPIGSYLGGEADTNKDSAVRAILTPIADLARKYSVAVVMVAHRKKGSSDTADESTMGSRAFTGLARAVWHVALDPDDSTKSRRLFLPGKNNLSKRKSGLAFRIGGETGSVVWEPGEVLMTADDAMHDEQSMIAEKRRPGRTPQKRNEIKKWLQHELSNGPKASKELEEAAEVVGHNWRTVQRAAKEIGIQYSARGSFNGGLHWSLPATDD